ncbi:Hypothetical Protein FCC1311_002842 [Hondaea fermentalgiana]|uniref:S1 motif domain-containing protein n=1 Tax=Hondaea fermentalgiana TaxID=2315210 RepID=A0A2R5FZ86_9STRA|nr:Hypothetical Protein FCC1311_002842 [Hondaea fermentalgiana]|eukprot:GBG24066.1 Hypothetical Protein FCC1311_002842 [Hondaea fermentalgiana]
MGGAAIGYFRRRSRKWLAGRAARKDKPRGLKWSTEKRKDGTFFSAGDMDDDDYVGIKTFEAEGLLGVAGLTEQEVANERKYKLDDVVSITDKKVLESCFEETQREDPLTFVRPGMRIKTRYVSTPNGGAFYDFGCGDLTTPRPLHTGMMGSSKAPNASALRSAAQAGNAAEESDENSFMGSIDVPMERSDLMLYEGQFLPSFSESNVKSSAGADAVALTWDTLEDAFRQKRPVQGRILNPMNGGFAVAVGSVVGFLPNSHISPFLRGPTSKHWEARTKGIIGEAIWVQVLNVQREESNLVVSHRTLPRHLLLPSLSESRSSPRRRSGPVPAPSVPAVEEKLAQMELRATNKPDRS